MENKVKVGLQREGSPYSEAECEEIIGKLESLLDGQLDGHEKAQAEALVKDCEYCMEQYNLERSIRKVIKNGYNNIFGAKNILHGIRDRIRHQASDDSGANA